MADQRLILTVGGETFVLAKRHNVDWHPSNLTGPIVSLSKRSLDDVLQDERWDAETLELSYEDTRFKEIDPELVIKNG